MAKKVAAKESVAAPRQKPSVLVDTRLVYCGDNLEQLAKLPDACVDLIYISFKAGLTPLKQCCAI